MTGAKRWVILMAAALLAKPAFGREPARAKFPRYCLTIAVPLRPTLRERVSVIDLVIQNAAVMAVPKFPLGWELKIQNWVDITPSRVFGGATGSVAELDAEDLKCMFIVEDSVPGTAPVKVTGNVYVSIGTHQHRVILRSRDIRLERVGTN